MSPPTAGGITVHRCVVRVVRRGGWSWGPDPQRLLQQVMDALPDLLAEEFDEQLTGDGPNVEITEPLSLTVRLRQSHSRLVPAEVVLFSPVADPTASRLPDPAAVTDPATASTAEPPSATHPRIAETPTTLFAELAERGELEPLLALLPTGTLRLYLAALFVDLPTATPIDETTVAGRLVAELVRRLPAPLPLETRDDVARLLGSWPEPRADSSAADPPGVDVRDATGETRIRSVLPFLLAGPLARIGYLDAIGPALAGADLLAETPLFAAALAYKVLGAGERGWRRTEADNAAAAAFAGLESVPDLTGFAQRVRPALPVLDGVLALSLCRGHDPAQPLLLAGVDGGLLLVDAQGMFPIAWGQEVADLAPRWEGCGRPPIVVCDSQLPPTCLRELAAVGVRFVTDIRPLRGDPVTRLPWRTPLWTFGDPDVRLAAELPAHAARLADLTQALVIERRAVPLAEDDALERSVTLAASLGLGMIAWMLWRDREAPDPVLALTRFADLEATIHFTPDAVKVRVPLGRRHADLLRCGALTDVPNVVWLNGRTLTFSGG